MVTHQLKVLVFRGATTSKNAYRAVSGKIRGPSILINTKQ